LQKKYFEVKIMSKDEDIRKQIIEDLKGAKFPIKSQVELENSFTNLDDNFASGGYQLNKEDAVHLLEDEDFPFNNAKEVAHVIIKRTNREWRMVG
jgi:hypothetical protein